MATSYDPALSTPKDHARLMLGDNGADGGVYLLQDEEINGVLGNVTFSMGVAILAEGLAVRFAQFPDEVDPKEGTGLKWRARVTAWQDLAKRMREEGMDPTRTRPMRRAAAVGTIGQNANPDRLRTSGPDGRFAPGGNPWGRF